MIFGIGVDLVNQERFIKILSKFDIQILKKKFLNLVEISQLETKLVNNSVNNSVNKTSNQKIANFFAKRFAAKEAFSKAIGLGIKYPITLNQISILHLPSGQPIIKLDEKLNTYLQQKLNIKIQNIHLSFSDEANQIIAFVVVEI